MLSPIQKSIATLFLALVFSSGASAALKKAPPIRKQIQCLGQLRQKSNFVGNYSFKLNYKMPKGGFDRHAGGEGTLLLRTPGHGAETLRLNCQMQIDLPGGLICLGSGAKNPFASALFLEIHPSKKPGAEKLKLFLGPWDSKPASTLSRAAGCQAQ